MLEPTNYETDYGVGVPWVDPLPKMFKSGCYNTLIIH